MRRYSLTFIIMFVIFLSACAVFKKEERPLLTEENTKLLELQKNISDMNFKLEELNNKFLLLQERLETDREEGLEPSGDTEDRTRTEGLKVVRLKETPPSEDAAALYESGQNQLLAGNYEEAREFFSAVVRNHPDHDLADNALYWLGESFYVERDYQNALLNFEEAISTYPDGNKTPDNMLKAGFSHIELGKVDKGVETLKKLIEKYPKSEAAFKAGKKLKGILTR